MRSGYAAFLLPALLACGSSDPLAYARERGRRVENLEASIPLQCYARLDAGRDERPGSSPFTPAAVRGALKTGANTCWTCHTDANGDNFATDFDLQAEYAFSDPARTNFWTNIFLDLAAETRAISDEAILDYVREDNYRALLGRDLGVVYTLDLDLDRGFDKDGFARDGSGWRAYKYQPFPGMGWLGSGNAGDAFLRLPREFSREFSRDGAGKESRAIAIANFAILEEAIAGEAPLPKFFQGAAQAIRVERGRFPRGTEFLHSVRYLDPEAKSFRARRMKELRYAKKSRMLDDWGINDAYARERDEKDEGVLPRPAGSFTHGMSNDFGWTLFGFIEDERGRLRVQSEEEQRFCLGCHSAIGVTVDQNFSFARFAGWGEQDLEGMKDKPQVGHRDPEALTYLRRARRADEFGANAEMEQRFFNGGVLDEAAVRRASTDRDLLWLLAPSRARALELDKSYRVLVSKQSFERGRAVLGPGALVHREILDIATGVEEVIRDGRARLIR